MDNDNKMELEEDEELSALRLAALATLKQRSTQNDNASFTQNNFCEPRHVVNLCDNSSSNQIPFIQSDRSNHSQATGHGWRKNGKNIQPVRRRPGVFLKSNQRSNLIVINPVSPNENSYSKEPTPSLALPQHKWYNSGNEDSMSPKTFRRTGPTRFNRHESDSDDSDSDFEKSDDSGSNETVLQDEPSENFSNITSESVRYEDANEKCRVSEHRLSFSAQDSQQNHNNVNPEKTTSVYHSLKCRSFEDPDVRSDISLRTTRIHNDSEQTWKSNNVSSEDHSKFEMESPMSDKHELSTQDLRSTSRIDKTDYEHQYVKNIEASKLNNAWNYSNLRKDYLYSSDDQYSSKNSEYQNVEAKRHSLPSSDLRTELKKSVEEYQNNKHMHSQKESCESWPPSHTETNDRSLKHNHSIDQKWQSSASRKSSLNDEYLNKEYLQNNSKNQELTLSSSNNFQSDSSKKKELLSDTRSRRKYSKSPEYWKRSRRRNNSQSSDSSHRGSSQSPQKRDEISVHQRKRSPSSDFSPKKRRPSTDYNHSDQSSTYKYKHRNRKSESPPRHRSRTPEHFQRKCKDSSDYTRWKHSKSSEINRTKHNQASDFAEKRSSKRDQIISDDSSDSSSSSTDRSWRKHNRSRERSKRRDRSWSNEADQKAERYGNELSSSQQMKSETSKHFLDVKRQGDSLGSSDVLLKSTNEKCDQKQMNYLQGTKDKNLTQLPENNENCRLVNNTRKSDFSPQQKSYAPKLDTNYSNSKYNTQTENKDHARNNEMKYGKHDQSRSRSSPHKYSNDKKFHSGDQKIFNRKKYSRSRSRSSSYSSTSSSSSSRSSPAIRSVSSVIKPVRLEKVKTEIKHDLKHVNKKPLMLEADLSSSVSVKRHNSSDRFSISSEISRDKTSINENRNHVTETTKRVPVHMRLGTFPRKRLIQMNKDVEAAFVTTSSDDETDVNIKCKKQNLRIVTEMYDSKTKGSCIIERKVEQDSNVSRERSRILKSSHR